MVQGRIGTQHHPPEGSGLSRRRRRPDHVADVVGEPDDRRARLLVGLDALVDPDGHPIGRRAVARWLPVITDPAVEPPPTGSVSLVVDPFGFELHLGDSGGAIEGAHPGEEFAALAVSDGVTVFVNDRDRHEVDLRRAGPDELAEAARRSALLGGLVRGFEVAVR